MHKQLKQAGFGHIILIIAIVLVTVIGFTGYKVFKHSKKIKTQDSSVATGGTVIVKNSNPTTVDTRTQQTKQTGIIWTYNNDSGYTASATPPKCPEPLLESPVDVNTVTAVLYPGQARGGNYKAHGGLQFGNNTTNEVAVKMPIDGRITGAVRYLEDIAGPAEIQYLVTFENQCGISIKFDHLRTLSPELQAIMDKQPEAKLNDTGGLSLTNGATFKKGALIATEVGRKSNVSVSMDFGVYDYRQKNEASKNATYAEAHKTSGYTDFYALCWLNNLSPDVNAKLNALPGGDGKMGKTSDYCK